MTKSIFSYDIETYLITNDCQRPKVVCLSFYDGKERGVVSADKGRDILLHRLSNTSDLIIAHNAPFDIMGMVNQYPELWKPFLKAFDDERVHCTLVREHLKNIACGLAPTSGKNTLSGLCLKYFDKNLEKPSFPYIKKVGKKSAAVHMLMQTPQYKDFMEAVQQQDQSRLPRPRENGKTRISVTTPPDFPPCDLSTEFGRLLAIKEFHGSWRLLFGELSEQKNVSDWPTDAINYALEDAEYCFEVWHEQEEWAKREKYDWHRECSNQTAFAYALGEMSANGMRVDQKSVEKFDRILFEKQLTIENRLFLDKIVYRKKDDTVSACVKVVQELVEKSWEGVGEVPRTEKGAIRYGEEVVKFCSDPSLKMYTQYKQIEKIRNTYLNGLKNKKSVHAQFICMGTATGRTSCRSPNLQNIPSIPGVRECFIPRDGYVFIACDYKSQELRTWAQACLTIIGRSKLAKLYQKDKLSDPHLMIAARLSGISYEEAAELKKLGDKKILKNIKLAKALNFGFPGGLQPKNFIEYAKKFDIKLSLKESTKYHEFWKKSWPEASSYLYATYKIFMSKKFMSTLVTKRRRVAKKSTEAANTYFQSLGSDCSKNALWNIFVACRTKGHILENCLPVHFIHDEIIVEVPIDRVEECGLEVQRIMETSMDEICSDVPSAAVPDAMDRWAKNSHERVDKIFHVDVDKIFEEYENGKI